ncbi:sulfotransferase family 2 domain-containing protein [Tropicibacter oceani]|uniref:Sulfotransferase family 2 domain-containing protein n=1 Tax=Tropicibacter oceani TaxID=3058420 RepID=A0ABY8QDG2_9RHOB|nr:sulfotransferase family 2 domain-containing protein [Tropicibacter oceani]WGW02659.1 sulfotransferase family 2 domain-containing protein [Tropicibacter oceani]
MIISHKHRYIFLHCRKTAGSSISVSLARDLGPDDLMLSALSETMAEGIAIPQRVTQAARDQLKTQPLFQDTSKRLALWGLGSEKARQHAIKKLALQYYRDKLDEPQPQHSYASSIAREFPREWAEYSKFCVVRNPWTKTVSDYFWRIKNSANPPDFAEFVAAIERGDSLGDIVRVRYHDNWPLYTIDNEIIADEVVRFEDLVPGLTAACARLNIPFDGWLPRAKGNHRPKSGKKADPLSFYTPELRDTVGRLYEKEIETFGYTFGPTSA